MQILDPFTIVWVVKKEKKLVTFSGPYYIESARTYAHNNGDVVLYSLRNDHNIGSIEKYPENMIKEAKDTEVFTTFKQAMKAFTHFHCEDTESIKNCIVEASRWYREGKEKKEKEIHAVPVEDPESTSIKDYINRGL